jgi:hypothetical protein
MLDFSASRTHCSSYKPSARPVFVAKQVTLGSEPLCRRGAKQGHLWDQRASIFNIRCVPSFALFAKGGGRYKPLHFNPIFHRHNGRNAM